MGKHELPRIPVCKMLANLRDGSQLMLELRVETEANTCHASQTDKLAVFRYHQCIPLHASVLTARIKKPGKKITYSYMKKVPPPNASMSPFSAYVLQVQRV